MINIKILDIILVTIESPPSTRSRPLAMNRTNGAMKRSASYARPPSGKVPHGPTYLNDIAGLNKPPNVIKVGGVMRDFTFRF